MLKPNHVPIGLAAIALLAGTASAQTAPADTPAVTVSGSAAIVSDYRFRGVSQSDRELAAQAGITLTHDSGVYIGTWGSNLAGWGTFGGANLELDLIGGYKAKLSDTGALDVGVTVYVYPGGFDRTTVVEPYAKLTGTAGPATLTAAVAYAPKQQSLGRVFFTGAAAALGAPNDPGDKEDNLYLWGDGAFAIAGSPLTAKAHIGHSDGNRGLGPNATSLAPTGKYWDWALGLDAAYKNLTFNLSYVDTDISKAESAYLQPSFSKGQDGAGTIAGATIVASVTAAF